MNGARGGHTQRTMIDVPVQVGTGDTTRLTPDEAWQLSRALWRVGELQGLRGGVTLAAALLDGRFDGRTVVITASQESTLRDALAWLGETGRLSGNLSTLAH